MSRLSVTLLGPFQVFRDGEPIRGFRYEKVRALFAYLIVEPHLPHRRQALAGLLWPDQAEGVARGNLRQALATLRRVLEESEHADQPLLNADRDTVQFAANGCDIDLDRFLSLLNEADGLGDDYARSLPHLESAVALYSHGFLHDLVLNDAPAFEAWLEGRRASLHGKYVGALEQLAKGLESMGELRRALVYNQQLLTADPWKEEFHRRQMRLLGRLGQPGAALNHYEAFQRRLEEEIGVGPEAETRAVFESIRNRSLEGMREGSEPKLPTHSVTASERRRLTLVNCALAASLDLEEMMDLAVAFRGLCEDIAARYGGSLGRFQGSEATFYFGYPAAMEDAPARAVRAALELIDGVAKLSNGIHACHAGAYTGMVVVGSKPHGIEVIGAAPQLATELRQMAGAGSLLIGATTQRLVERYFVCEELGSRHFPQWQRELKVFRVTGSNGVFDRLGAAIASGLPPLTGRDQELTALLAGARQAGAGSGCGILLKGEAGIGKSRLALRLKEQLTAEGWLLRECRGSPQNQGSPFQVVIGLIEQLCGIGENDVPQVRIEKAEAQLSSYSVPLSETMPIIAELLALEVRERYPRSRLPPEPRRRQTIELLSDLLLDRARQVPVFLLVEDLHWIDPSSLELLDLLLRRLSNAPIFVLLTARPELSRSWDNIKEIVLPSLSPVQSEALVRHLAGDVAVSQTLVATIVQHSDGVPLFIEEMAKTLLGALAKGAEPPVENEKIPGTLYDLLMVRIDGLGAAKSTLQLAATLGREFSWELIAAVSRDDHELAEKLRLILDSGLLLEQETRSGKVYVFKHALIQEAAYHSQLLKGRQETHKRIAEVLIHHKPGMVHFQPELIAQHLLVGGETDRAIHYWLQAGQLNIERSANAEAMSHLKTALALLLEQPDSEARRRKELEIQIALGVVLLSLTGYGSSELKSTYARALELSEALNERKLLFHSLWGLWLSASSRSGYREAVELARELLRVAEQEAEPALLIYAHNTMAGSHLWLGELATSLKHARQVETMYVPAEHDPLLYSFGDSVAVTTFSYHSWLAWLTGQSELALIKSSQALAAAERLNHSHSKGFALTFAAMLHFLRNEPEKTLMHAQDILRLDEEHPLWSAAAAMFIRWVRVVSGDHSALGEISLVLDSMREAMVGVEVSFLVPVACSYKISGQLEAALTVLENGLEIAEAIDDRYLEAELHRLKGECLLGLGGNESSAQGCFERALQISRRQSARMLELRASVSLGRLLIRQNRRREAGDLVGQVYAGFQEGFDTTDLREAASFLSSMGEQVLRNGMDCSMPEEAIERKHQ